MIGYHNSVLNQVKKLRHDVVTSTYTHFTIDDRKFPKYRIAVWLQMWTNILSTNPENLYPVVGEDGIEGLVRKMDIIKTQLNEYNWNVCREPITKKKDHLMQSAFDSLNKSLKELQIAVKWSDESTTTDDTVYIVGKLFGHNLEDWLICGVFTSKAKAETACISQNRFVGPMSMNEFNEELTWPGMYYPMRKP